MSPRPPGSITGRGLLVPPVRSAANGRSRVVAHPAAIRVYSLSCAAALSSLAPHPSRPPSLAFASRLLFSADRPGSLVYKAIRRQSAEVQRLNDEFVLGEGPHVLLVSIHGYTGPKFPPSYDADTGGQIECVNQMAIELAHLGYRVTIATRSFRPDDNLVQTYGDRKGVHFFPDNPRVRYVYVPGYVEEYLLKTVIYSDLPAIGRNLAAFLEDEASIAQVDPWEYVRYMSSHYVDGGLVAQRVVRQWQNIFIKRRLLDRFRAILPADFLSSRANYVGSPYHYLGTKVVEAWHTAQGGVRPWDRQAILQWIGQRLGWNEMKIANALRTFPPPAENGDATIGQGRDVSSLGKLLFQRAGGIKGVVRGMDRVNCHAWTPHSLGRLKERNMELTGAADANRHKYLEQNFPQRGQAERGLVGGAVNGALESGALFMKLPPARALVPTSVEILETLFELGATPEIPMVFFPPGTDVQRYYPRQNLHDPEVQAFFAHLREEHLVQDQLLDKMFADPQKYSLVVEASRMDRTKRKEVIIRAMLDLPEETILFISGQRDSHGVYDGLYDLIKELNLEHRVFLLGRVPDEWMGPLMGLPFGVGEDRFHLVVAASASRMEGWGMAVAEMAAGGYPVIASPMVPFAMHVAREDRGAVIVPLGPDEPRRYANEIKRLLDDPARAAQLAERGNVLARGFSWPGLTQKFDNQVQLLLETE